MNNQLLLQNNINYKPPAPVIPARKSYTKGGHKKNDGQEKIDSQEMQENKLPSFYTEPIFKARKHDCL